MGLLITIIFLILAILLVCASYSALIYKSIIKNDKEFLEDIHINQDMHVVQTPDPILDNEDLKGTGYRWINASRPVNDNEDYEHNRKMLDQEIKNLGVDRIDE